MIFEDEIVEFDEACGGEAVEAATTGVGGDFGEGEKFDAAGEF